MVSKPSSTQPSRVSQETRERFVADAGRMMVEIVAAAQERMAVLMNRSAVMPGLFTRK
jgi:hypothetical protein